ncbi:histone acetyltransferase GCN5-like protein [Jackrogersella minutella]|nr:histone acetyltransferase GCN5-like protein [Jackrogersella minutella]
MKMDMDVDVDELGSYTSSVEKSPHIAKRGASEEPHSPPATKRSKVSNDDDKHDVQPQVTTKTETETEAVPFPYKHAVLEEKNGDIEFRVVNNDGAFESTIVLTGLKRLFQKQLPFMPQHYIARLVLDYNHLSIAIIKQPLEVIGGITYKPFPDRKIAEIAFCAVSPGNQIKGYGKHLMDHFKDYVKASSPIMHLLTYADNTAIGYFKKQGFTKEITLEKSLWKGCIKDYEGGTLMQCSMVPRVRYLEARRMLHKQKENVLAKIEAESKSHIVHKPPAQWADGNITPIDPLSIPAIRATGWTPDMDKLSQQSRHGNRFNEYQRFLDLIQNHKHAWPFLNPVNADDVPGYYDFIKSPMDISTMEDKLQQDQYHSPKDVIDDMKLIFSNCRSFNDKASVYYKSAGILEKYMWTLIKKFPGWSNLVKRKK